MAVTVADTQLLLQTTAGIPATITLDNDFAVQSNDVLLFFVARPSQAVMDHPGTVTPFRQAGVNHLTFQQGTNLLTTAVYYKIADGTEGGDSFNFALTTAGLSRRAAITCLCIRGADITNISSWPAGGINGSATTPASPQTQAINTTGFGDGCLMIASLNYGGGSVGGRTTAPPGGGDTWVEHSDHATTNGSGDVAQAVFSMTQTTAGTFTARTWTPSTSGGGGAYGTFSFGIPASTGATIPGVPTGVSAVAGNRAATVSFSVPGTDGGSAITGYTATSTPGSITASGASSPLSVSGLTNGTSYTFTVHATNAVGNSIESSASNAVAPSGPLVWNGSAWVPATRKVWNGSAWENV